MFNKLPPTSIPYYFPLVFLLAILILDSVLTLNLTLHMTKNVEDERAFVNYGWAYFFVYPGLTLISPIFGLFNIFFCSPLLLKLYIRLTTLCIVTNLSLTLFLQIILTDRFYYIGLVLINIVLKTITVNLGGFTVQMF